MYNNNNNRLKHPGHALEREREEKAEKAFFRKLDLFLGLILVTTLILLGVFMFHVIQDTLCR